MSQSQKFQGKVLVPWYNTAEWKYVSQILCGAVESKYPKALEILKIWKIRVPFLAAGVEGTLIILETFLHNKNLLSDEQVVQICSISLVRFLNLTAANNDKQGTFYQTVMKNDLPNWLIDIRHDIAHNNKLPSRAILELAIRECFDWVIKKYWKVQGKTICDYLVTQNPEDSKITDLLSIYCQLKTTLYYERGITAQNEALFQKINYFVTKRHNTQSTDFNGILKILEEMLKQSLESIECKQSSEDIAQILITEGLLTLIQIDDFENIPNTFLDIWNNILNILIDNGFLFILLKKLHTTTKDLLVIENLKKISSLWIKEIFQGLVKFKETVDCVGIKPTSNCLSLSSNGLSSFDSKLLEKSILEAANTYTLIYLNALLDYNGYSVEDIAHTIHLVKSMVSEVHVSWKEDNTESFEQVEKIVDNIMDFQEIITHTITECPPVSQTRCKWVKVKNKELFEGLPLGILPHQDRSRNPCLVLD